MQGFADITARYRKALLPLWGVFAIFVFSQYMYRFAHHAPWGMEKGIEYAIGFASVILLPWIGAILFGLSGYIVGQLLAGLLPKYFSFTDKLEETVCLTGFGFAILTLIVFAAKSSDSALHYLSMAFMLLPFAGFPFIKRLWKTAREASASLNWNVLDSFLFVTISACLLVGFSLPCNITGSSIGPFSIQNAILIIPTAGNVLGICTTIFYLLMIGSTALVYLIGDRLSGRTVGLIAAVLFLLMKHSISPFPFATHLTGFFVLLAAYSWIEAYKSKIAIWNIPAVLSLITAGICVPTVMNFVWPVAVIFAALGINAIFVLTKFNPRNRVHLAWMFLALTLAFGIFYRDSIYSLTSPNLINTAVADQTPQNR